MRGQYNPRVRSHMKCPKSFVLLTVMMFTACTAPRPLEQQSVHDAAAALGGAERLQSVKTLVIEGEGTQYNLGQDVVPGASGQTYAVTQYKRAIDVAAERARTELVRIPKFTYWQGLAPQRQVQGIDKEIGYNRSEERRVGKECRSRWAAY